MDKAVPTLNFNLIIISVKKSKHTHTHTHTHVPTYMQEEDAQAKVLENFFKRTGGGVKIDFETTMEVDIDGEVYVCPPDTYKGDYNYGFPVLARFILLQSMT